MSLNLRAMKQSNLWKKDCSAAENPETSLSALIYASLFLHLFHDSLSLLSYQLHGLVEMAGTSYSQVTVSYCRAVTQ